MFNPLDWMYHRNFQVREGQLGNGASSNEEGKLESNAPRGCTVKMIQRTHNEGQSPVVMCSACGVVVTRLRFRFLKESLFIIGKRQAAFVTTVIPFDI